MPAGGPVLQYQNGPQARPVQGWMRAAMSASRTQLVHSGLPLQVRT